MIALLFALLLFAAPAAADTIDDGCPCASWEADGTPCTGNVITITVDDPGSHCGDNGTATMTLELDSSYTYGCYADHYSVWIDDPSNGAIGITGITNATDFGVDPLLDGYRNTNSEPLVHGGYWPFDDPLPSSLNPTTAGRAISLSGVTNPYSCSADCSESTSNDLWKSVPGMAGSCSSGNYRHIREFAYTWTMVPSPPTNNGQTVLRPPWNGTVKTEFTTTAMDLSILPTHDLDDINMPNPRSRHDAIGECVLPPYHTSSIDAAAVALFNFPAYHTDGTSKLSGCIGMIGFSQGSGSLSADDRMIAIAAAAQNGQSILELMRQGDHMGWYFNSGLGQNVILWPAFFSALYASETAAFKNRFTQEYNDDKSPGYEFIWDGGIWRHGNGAAYWGGPQPNRPPPGGGPTSAECDTSEGAIGCVQPCNGKVETVNSACRDGINADDSWTTGGYQWCCSTAAFYGLAGAAYMYPAMVDVLRSNDTSRGSEMFDYLARYEEFGGAVANGGGVGGRPKGTLAHDDPFGEGIYDALTPCAITVNASGATTTISAYPMTCPGHTTASSPLSASLNCGGPYLAGDTATCNIGAAGGDPGYTYEKDCDGGTNWSASGASFTCLAVNPDRTASARVTDSLSATDTASSLFVGNLPEVYTNISGAAPPTETAATYTCSEPCDGRVLNYDNNFDAGGWEFDLDGDGNFAAGPEDTCSDLGPGGFQKPGFCDLGSFAEGVYTIAARSGGQTGSVTLTVNPPGSGPNIERLKVWGDQGTVLQNPMDGTFTIDDDDPLLGCLGFEARAATDATIPSGECVYFTHEWPVGQSNTLANGSSFAYGNAGSDSVCIISSELTPGTHTITATRWDGPPDGGGNCTANPNGAGQPLSFMWTIVETDKLSIQIDPVPTDLLDPADISLRATATGPSSGSGNVCFDCGDGLYDDCVPHQGLDPTFTCSALTAASYTFDAEWQVGGCTPEPDGAADCLTAAAPLPQVVISGYPLPIGTPDTPSDYGSSTYGFTTYVHAGLAAIAPGEVTSIDALFTECEEPTVCTLKAFIARASGCGTDQFVNVHNFEPLPVANCTRDVDCAPENWTSADGDFTAFPVEVGDRIGWFLECDDATCLDENTQNGPQIERTTQQQCTDGSNPNCAWGYWRQVPDITGQTGCAQYIDSTGNQFEIQIRANVTAPAVAPGLAPPGGFLGGGIE